jgi:hypothetical protein
MVSKNGVDMVLRSCRIDHKEVASSKRETVVIHKQAVVPWTTKTTQHDGKKSGKRYAHELHLAQDG